jgi:predicted RNase H-like HicB family nuclease
MQGLTVGERFTVVKDGVEFEFEAAEEGGYVASVPLYPSALSQGDTFEEALENVIDALSECLATARELGLEVPPELVHIR